MAEPPAPQGIRRDAQDLQRGIAANLLGYVLKLLNPVLLILVVRRYGSEEFGLFSLAQATVMFAARVTALGLDKGVLWWIPRQPDATARSGIRPALQLSGVASLAVALAMGLAAGPAVLRALGAAPDVSTTLRLVALGLPLQVVMDVLVHACMGRRHVATQVLVKDTLVPTAFVGLALALHVAGLTGIGLALAFVLGNAAGVVAATWTFRRAFAGTTWPAGEGSRPPAGLVRYAMPMWLNEISNSLLQRIDTWAVGAFAHDLSAVGVWAVVARIANQVRDIRRSFDPIVLAITSGMGRDRDRLRSGFSRATFLVSATQIPVFVFLLMFARFLMPLYGPGFVAGTVPVVILCGFWLVNGIANLAGVVVSAQGRSRLTLFNTLFAAAALGAAAMVLIPRYGIVGAALAVGLAYSAQGALQLVQMRGVTGSWNLDRSVLGPVALGLAGGAALVGVWLLVGEGGPLGLHLPALATRIGAFAAFALVYGVGAWRLWPRA